MQATTILNIILVIISLDYLFNLILGLLNYNSFDRSIPKNLKGIYDEKEYIKSQKNKLKKLSKRMQINVECFMLMKDG